MKDNEPTEEDWADYGEWCKERDKELFEKMAEDFQNKMLSLGNQ